MESLEAEMLFVTGFNRIFLTRNDLPGFCKAEEDVEEYKRCGGGVRRIYWAIRGSEGVKECLKVHGRFDPPNGPFQLASEQGLLKNMTSEESHILGEIISLLAEVDIPVRLSRRDELLVLWLGDPDKRWRPEI